jgi:transcriptional regulator with XRE-family HTH domain
MIVGERLKAIREMKGLSQGDIEKRTGLLRCYISRVENGHTVPAIETLEKMARAMEVELYQLFFEPNGKKEPQELKLPSRPALKMSRKHAGVVSRLGSLIPRISERDQHILLNLARKMAAR